MISIIDIKIQFKGAKKLYFTYDGLCAIRNLRTILKEKGTKEESS